MSGKSNGISDGIKIIATGMGLFTAGIGTAFYVSGLESEIKLERERRADNELLMSELEGEIRSLSNRIAENEDRTEIYLQDMSERITDNRVMLSDWIAEVNSSRSDQAAR